MGAPVGRRPQGWSSTGFPGFLFAAGAGGLSEEDEGSCVRDFPLLAEDLRQALEQLHRLLTPSIDPRVDTRPMGMGLGRPAPARVHPHPSRLLRPLSVLARVEWATQEVKKEIQAVSFSWAP